MSATIQLKRGDTLRLKCTARNGSTPTDLTGITIRSQVRSGATLAHELDVDVSDQVVAPGEFFLSASATVTAAWPVEPIQCDVEYTYPSGDVVSSPTFTISIVADVTR